MKKTMVFGTFDIFHPGHRSFLRQACQYGNYLIVIIARDKTVLAVKKKRIVNSERERLKVVKKSGLADEVVLGNLGDKYKIIKKYKPDVICLGYDQKFFVDNLETELGKIGLKKTKIVRLKSYKPEIYKSSKLKKLKKLSAGLKK